MASNDQLITANDPQPGAAPVDAVVVSSITSSSKPSTVSSSPKKKEKKQYPALRAELFQYYGLSVRDHFIASCYKKYNTTSFDDNDDFFREAIKETFSIICVPFLPTKFTLKDKKLKNKSLLQIFSIRDISKTLQKQDQTNTGHDKNRMLYFVLTDGKTKINAIEYQHCSVLDNIGIFPGTKLQLENVEIRNGVLLLRPSSVLWVGGDVESFRIKFLKSVQSRDKDTRVHQKSLLKGETPPPQFEDNKPKSKIQKDIDEYKDNQQQRQQQQQSPAQAQPQAQPYQQQQQQQHVQPQSQAQPYQQQQQQYPQQQSGGYGHGYDNYYDDGQYYNDDNGNYYDDNSGYYDDNQQQMYAPHQQQISSNNNNNNNNQLQQQYKPKTSNNNNQGSFKNGQQSGLQQQNPNVQVKPAPLTLIELYGKPLQSLPYRCSISAEIISANLKSHLNGSLYVEFDISDSTGKCKGMTSDDLLIWINKQYNNGAQHVQSLNAIVVARFFADWGRKYITIDMELTHPQQMVVFHSFK